MSRVKFHHHCAFMASECAFGHVLSFVGHYSKLALLNVVVFKWPVVAQSLFESCFQCAGDEVLPCTCNPDNSSNITLVTL